MCKTKYSYSDGSTWKYKRSWFDPHVSKASRCWKDQRKAKHQYRPVEG